MWISRSHPELRFISLVESVMSVKFGVLIVN